MGKRFVSDYCRLVTGEKDPRNLRLLFSIDRIVILEFDISDNVEVSLSGRFKRPTLTNLYRKYLILHFATFRSPSRLRRMILMALQVKISKHLFGNPHFDCSCLISADILLRSCLAASPRFGHLAIPLFLEKLQANTNTARRQSLQALTEALPVYGKATVTASAVLLWEAINLEVSGSPS